MRLATLRVHATHTRAARLDGDESVLLSHADVGALLADPRWPEIAAADGERGPQARPDPATLVPHPNKIICLGLNYATHIAEMGRPTPAYPTLFAKYDGSLIGARDDIHAPEVSDALDWEAELGVVIGRPGRRVPETDALDHVAGYTVVNDITVRDWQHRTREFLSGKTFESTTPVGPVLVTPDELPPGAAGLDISCRVDGHVMQESNTGDLLSTYAPSSATSAPSSRCCPATSSPPALRAGSAPAATPRSSSRPVRRSSPRSRGSASSATASSRTGRSPRGEPDPVVDGPNRLSFGRKRPAPARPDGGFDGSSGCAGRFAAASSGDRCVVSRSYASHVPGRGDSAPWGRFADHRVEVLPGSPWRSSTTRCFRSLAGALSLRVGKGVRISSDGLDRSTVTAAANRDEPVTDSPGVGSISAVGDDGAWHPGPGHSVGRGDLGLISAVLHGHQGPQPGRGPLPRRHLADLLGKHRSVTAGRAAPLLALATLRQREPVAHREVPRPGQYPLLDRRRGLPAPRAASGSAVTSCTTVLPAAVSATRSIARPSSRRAAAAGPARPATASANRVRSTNPARGCSNAARTPA